MKKILSLILILVMSVCSFGAYAEDYSSKSLGELCDIYTDVLHELFIKMQESGDAIAIEGVEVLYADEDLEVGAYLFLNLADAVQLINIFQIPDIFRYEGISINGKGEVMSFVLKHGDRINFTGPGILLRTDSLPRP